GRTLVLRQVGHFLAPDSHPSRVSGTARSCSEPLAEAAAMPAAFDDLVRASCQRASDLVV
ncbi:MAG TPA: hypothetical protein DCR65_12045, partial [Gammaproteobacteria bacterium]|nr:hypothetical protein [Gammaproteobacteria bacterium]